MLSLPRKIIARRRFSALIAILMANGCSALPTGIRASTRTARLAAHGRWLITRGGKFYVFDLDRRQETLLSHFPSNAYAAAPALAPDGKRVAYIYYVVPTNANDLGGSDLYVMDVDGSNARLIQSHARPGRSFQDPCWAADGRDIYAGLRAPAVGGPPAAQMSTTIVRVPLDGGAPTEIASGQSPAVSPDGAWLAYLTVERQATMRLWVSNPDGSSARELVAVHGANGLAAPRFSPDSRRIVFAAASAPTTASRSSLAPFVAPFVPAIAEANGTPMDLWTIRPDGTELRRLTASLDHSPIPAWSPDGKWIAVAGELSLTLVAADGTGSERVGSNAQATGIVWLV